MSLLRVMKNTTKQVTRLYKTALTKHPILTQSVQTGFLMGTGDFFAQKIEQRQKFKEHNFVRTAQFFCIGLFIGGPSLRLWYGILDKNIKVGSKTMITFKKVLIDQSLFAPAFLAVLVTAIGKTQNLNFNEIKHKLKAEYPDILLANYFVWPWVQLANFYFIPLNFQVLVVQVVALFFNTYLSWKTHQTKDINILD